MAPHSDRHKLPRVGDEPTVPPTEPPRLRSPERAPEGGATVGTGNGPKADKLSSPRYPLRARGSKRSPEGGATVGPDDGPKADLSSPRTPLRAVEPQRPAEGGATVDSDGAKSDLGTDASPSDAPAHDVPTAVEVATHRVELYPIAEPCLGELSENAGYLLVRGADAPIARIPAGIGYEQLGYDVAEALDDARTDEQRDDAARRIGAPIGRLLRVDELPEAGFLHVDLVLSSPELDPIPFELALDGDGRPAFVTTPPACELTRRVRHPGLPPRRGAAAARPRVLFVHATPRGASVPAAEHRQILEELLRPWAPPIRLGGELHYDYGRVITEIADATLAEIAHACASAAAEDQPYTHVHILAHGTDAGEARVRHQLRLKSPDGNDADIVPIELVEALSPVLSETVVATLASCNGGNESGRPGQRQSFAFGLHAAGVPVVVATQLPLTILGSEVLVDQMYRGLLAGTDVRVALHQARSALYTTAGTDFDWASLVGYVRLPTNYATHLLEARQRASLERLKTTDQWAAALARHADSGSKGVEVEDVVVRLDRELDLLDGDADAGIEHAVEQDGLRASALKRRAELLHRTDGLDVDGSESRRSLTQARDQYRRAYWRNRSSHWNGTQYLCLEAILSGEVPLHEWICVLDAARLVADGAPDVGIRPGEPRERIWAYGSLAELHLLAPMVVDEDHRRAAERCVLALVELARGAELTFEIDSTRRQLQRHRDWWSHGGRIVHRRYRVVAEGAERLIELLRGEPSNGR